VVKKKKKIIIITRALQNIWCFEKVNSTGGRVEMLEKVVQVANHDSSKLSDGHATQKESPAQQNPREIHGLFIWL
jgi:hypothetical protein